MISAEIAIDALVVCVALVAGYLAGSIPLAGRVARLAGLDRGRDGGPNPEVADVWLLAGPGWGLLALTGDLAKGVVPVAIGLVTWSWAAGWVAGLGALLGACWPAFGRLPGDRGMSVLGGVAFALAPPAGVVSALIVVLVLGVGRLAGRATEVPAIVIGMGSFAVLILAVGQDAARLGAVLALYLVVAVRYVTTRDH